MKLPQNLFHCKFCGKKIHADTNTAKNVKERFLDDNSWLFVKRDKIHQQLDEQFHSLWGLPVSGANKGKTHTALAGSLQSVNSNTVNSLNA